MQANTHELSGGRAGSNAEQLYILHVGAYLATQASYSDVCFVDEAKTPFHFRMHRLQPRELGHFTLTVNDDKSGLTFTRGGTIPFPLKISYPPSPLVFVPDKSGRADETSGALHMLDDANAEMKLVNAPSPALIGCDPRQGTIQVTAVLAHDTRWEALRCWLEPVVAPTPTTWPSTPTTWRSTDLEFPTVTSSIPLSFPTYPADSIPLRPSKHPQPPPSVQPVPSTPLKPSRRAAEREKKEKETMVFVLASLAGTLAASGLLLAFNEMQK